MSHAARLRAIDAMVEQHALISKRITTALWLTLAPITVFITYGLMPRSLTGDQPGVVTFVLLLLAVAGFWAFVMWAINAFHKDAFFHHQAALNLAKVQGAMQPKTSTVEALVASILQSMGAQTTPDRPKLNVVVLLTHMEADGRTPLRVCLAREQTVVLNDEDYAQLYLLLRPTGHWFNPESTRGWKMKLTNLHPTSHQRLQWLANPPIVTAG